MCRLLLLPRPYQSCASNGTHMGMGEIIIDTWPAPHQVRCPCPYHSIFTHRGDSRNYATGNSTSLVYFFYRTDVRYRIVWRGVFIIPFSNWWFLILVKWCTSQLTQFIYLLNLIYKYIWEKTFYGIPIVFPFSRSVLIFLRSWMNAAKSGLLCSTAFTRAQCCATIYRPGPESSLPFLLSPLALPFLLPQSPPGFSPVPIDSPVLLLLLLLLLLLGVKKHSWMLWAYSVAYTLRDTARCNGALGPRHGWGTLLSLLLPSKTAAPLTTSEKVPTQASAPSARCLALRPMSLSPFMAFSSASSQTVKQHLSTQQ